MTYRPTLFTSALITQFAPIASDLDDTEPIFEMLRSATQARDFQEAGRIANGLIKRIHGTVTDKAL